MPGQPARGRVTVESTAAGPLTWPSFSTVGKVYWGRSVPSCGRMVCGGFSKAGEPESRFERGRNAGERDRGRIWLRAAATFLERFLKR